MKRLWVFALLLAPVMAFSLTATEIIRRVDSNEIFSTQRFTMTMTIQRGTRTLVKTIVGYGQREGQKFFMEYTNPEDKGVKYLKIGDEMWIYFPDADDTMKISGHMLEEGMMGSDISYEDMMENDKLEDKYTATLLSGETNIDGRSCYVIDLNAKVDDVTYQREVVYIDTERFVMLKVDLYARGGRLIKTMLMSDVRSYGSRWYATKMVIMDRRRQNSQTTIQFDSLQFDVSVPSGTFTMQNLRR